MARGKQLLIRDELPGPAMTSFVFHLPDVPSALFKALGGCATNGVTRRGWKPTRWPSASTMVLVDTEGHSEDLPWRLAIEKLEFFTTEILGVYAAAEFRTARTVVA
jgi:prephenate dehydratase